ncbi:MAG: hypothetical protein DHS20C15_12890 [Planctomycetota bacterium]|nr:MAG: hypothetical protein DHS20C15_12890 [Planctomycetota bacterium]
MDNISYSLAELVEVTAEGTVVDGGRRICHCWLARLGGGRDQGAHRVVAPGHLFALGNAINRDLKVRFPDQADDLIGFTVEEVCYRKFGPHYVDFAVLKLDSHPPNVKGGDSAASPGERQALSIERLSTERVKACVAGDFALLAFSDESKPQLRPVSQVTSEYDAVVVTDKVLAERSFSGVPLIDLKRNCVIAVQAEAHLAASRSTRAGEVLFAGIRRSPIARRSVETLFEEIAGELSPSSAFLKGFRAYLQDASGSEDSSEASNVFGMYWRALLQKIAYAAVSIDRYACSATVWGVSKSLNARTYIEPLEREGDFRLRQFLQPAFPLPTRRWFVFQGADDEDPFDDPQEPVAVRCLGKAGEEILYYRLEGDEKVARWFEERMIGIVAILGVPDKNWTSRSSRRGCPVCLTIDFASEPALPIESIVGDARKLQEYLAELASLYCELGKNYGIGISPSEDADEKSVNEA